MVNNCVMSFDASEDKKFPVSPYKIVSCHRLQFRLRRYCTFTIARCLLSPPQIVRKIFLCRRATNANTIHNYPRHRQSLNYSLLLSLLLSKEPILTSRGLPSFVRNKKFFRCAFHCIRNHQLDNFLTLEFEGISFR